MIIFSSLHNIDEKCKNTDAFKDGSTRIECHQGTIREMKRK